MVVLMTLGIVSFHLVMWGVYKARENIHHPVADQLLLTISASCRRDATYNPNFISSTPSSNLSRMFYWNKDTQNLDKCDYIDLYEFNTLDCNPPFEDLWDTLLFYSPQHIDIVLIFFSLIFPPSFYIRVSPALRAKSMSLIRAHASGYIQWLYWLHL